MQVISGRIERWLTGPTGEVHGIVLDNGQAITFPVESAREVLSIVAIGSHVEIQAAALGVHTGNTKVNAAVITDLSSSKSVALSGLGLANAPEVCADVCPPPGAALTPLAPASQATPAQRATRVRSAFPEKVTDVIEQAYDRLHRTQVMLAFLKTDSREKLAISQYLTEAKRTYVQALGRYQSRDLEGARECAAASSDLAYMVDILISRAVHSSDREVNSDSRTSSAVRVPESVQTVAIHDNLDRIESLLGRIQWVTTNGTLPSEDRDQVQKLVLWSESLKRWACRLLDIGAGDEASEFAHAAEAAAGAAEHVCKKSYVSRCADSRPTTAAHQ